MAVLPRAFQLCFKTWQFQAVRTFSVTSYCASHHQRFCGQTAIVTGSTQGIGLATAQRLAEEGAQVVICSRQQRNVDEALDFLRKKGLDGVSGLACDVSQKKARDELINHTISKHPKGIDILVSNVGVFLAKHIVDTSSEEWDEYINLNLKSHALLTQETLPHIRKRGKGSVVYISTAAAYRPVPQSSVYGVAKGAMLIMTKMAGMHLAPENIRVNCVVPGLIETDMAQKALTQGSTKTRYLSRSLLKRIGNVYDISGVIAFLCSDDASYITGESIIVSGGVHCRI